MELVLKFKLENLKKIKELLLKDEFVSKASIIFKDGKNFGKEEYFCYLSGTKEQIERAKNLTKEFAEEAEEAEDIIKLIKSEEQKAMQGFGAIFR